MPKTIIHRIGSTQTKWIKEHSKFPIKEEGQQIMTRNRIYKGDQEKGKGIAKQKGVVL